MMNFVNRAIMTFARLTYKEKITYDVCILTQFSQFSKTKN
jgi:hypothetical protein